MSNTPANPRSIPIIMLGNIIVPTFIVSYERTKPDSNPRSYFSLNFLVNSFSITSVDILPSAIPLQNQNSFITVTLSEISSHVLSLIIIMYVEKLLGLAKLISS